MDRNECANDGGSSTDTVIARSSSEEEKPKPIAVSGSIRAECIVIDDNSSSRDIPASSAIAILSSGVNADEQKRGKFDAFKSNFREGGIFNIKKKPREIDAFPEADAEQDEKALRKQTEDREITRRRSQRLEREKEPKLPEAPSTSKKKKKKSHSLVRKLSLNKFRPSSEQQEIRHTPEGGDSNRSQSQFSQESRVIRPYTKKGQADDEVSEREEEAKGEFKKSESSHEKSAKTVALVQYTSPSLTIARTAWQEDTEQHSQRQRQDNASRIGEQCISTLPYALSKWPERNETRLAEDGAAKRGKLQAKSDSDSTDLRTTSGSSLVEVRRKLSLLEEKRALLQRRFLNSSNLYSENTAIAHGEGPSSIAGDKELHEQRDKERKRKPRQISVRTFDAFSLSESSLDAKARLDLGDIEEIYTESYNSADNNYRTFYAAMAPMMGAMDLDKSSSNNAPNLGVSEKREHLYKILVIGELGAGKTSIIKRYVHQFFSQHYRATIGVDFALKVLNWDPHTIIRLQLWDIAGQERFGNMTRVYYKEAVGAFIVFDVTRSATLDAVVKWKQDLDSKVQLPDGSPIPCVLLANKCDQQKEGLVNSPNKMDEYCKEKNFSGWFETSAKENINIEEAAKFLVNKILQNDHVIRGNDAQDQTDNERFALNQLPTNSKKSCSC